jgi:hypothetical protein
MAVTRDDILSYMGTMPVIVAVNDTLDKEDQIESSYEGSPVVLCYTVGDTPVVPVETNALFFGCNF